MLVKFKFKNLLPLMLFSVGSYGFAGMVEQIDFIAQPLVNVKQGDITGCGYRLIGSKINTSGGKKSNAIDLSFNLYIEGVAAVKGGLLEFDVKSLQENKSPQPIAIKNFWVKSKGAKATNPINNQIIKSQSPVGYMLYTTEVENVVPLFGAVYAREQVMIGYRRANEDFDRVFNGSITLTDAEEKQIQDCVVELLSNMEKLK